MQEKKITVGVLGTGLAGQIHTRALQQIPGVRVKGASASSMQSASLFQSQFNLEVAYANWEQLLADDEITVVHNCLPNTLHLPVSKAAIECGKHVLSDKPLGISSQETQILLDMVCASNAIDGLSMNYRGLPMIQKAKTLIDGGALGDLLYVRGRYLQSYNLAPLKQAWKSDGSMIGSSYVTADLGYHWLDLLLYLTGEEVAQLQASFASLGHCPPNVENFSTVSLQTQTGATVQAMFSKISAGYQNGLMIEMAGSKGLLRWDQTKQEELVYQSAQGDIHTYLRGVGDNEAPDVQALPPQHHGGWVDGFVNVFDKYYAAVREGKPGKGYPTFADGHRINQIVDAMIESAKSHKNIVLG
ncbi:MAG: Gfo/Idh/MocA family oxidoreductase [Deltaproteobacteria bacterium]|nr:Gfo/Idh/MocA family oxidoreductase [Deltaproteobacteria bacterium]